MTTGEKEVSCYSTRLLLRYAQSMHLRHALDGIAISADILNNPQEWTYATVLTAIAGNIEKELNRGPEVIEEIIQEVFFNDHHVLFPLLIRILPLTLIINSIQKYGKRYSNKNMVAEAKSRGKNRWEYKVTRAVPGHYSPQMCAFNKGGIKALLTIKGYTDITITETSCMAHAHTESCTYLVAATPSRSPGSYLKNMISNRQAIISHLEENRRTLEQQYKELLSTRDFYSHIMKNMNEAIVWLNAEGIITFANRAFQNLTGSTEESLVGSRFEKHLMNEFMSAQFKLHCSDARQKPSTPLETEFSFTADGNEQRIGATTIIWIPGEYFSPGYIISIRDITEKRIIERQLSVAEDRYRSLYENSPAIIVAIGTTGKFLYANPAMTEQSGYTEAQLKNMHFKELIAPRADFNVDHLLTNVLASPRRLQEVHFKTSTGEWKCVALNTYHIFGNDGELAGIAGIGIDITETKRLNEQLIRTQRMDILGQLAGGLAHDFGNVLTSINGFGKLIADKATDEKIQKYARSIEKAGLRAHELVKSLLAFSRNDSTESRTFDVVPIVDEVHDMLRGALPSNVGMELHLPEIPLLINGDPGKIHQCILNLCINARDAIGENKGTITLRTLKIANPPDKVHVQVEDTGCGIPPDIIDKIYDPFFSTKKNKGGTGLGLSVVYGIIKSHNGDIFVDSHPGEGTIFTLELPLVQRPLR